MAKAMKEISSGAQKWAGEKWFAELFFRETNYTRQVLCQSVSFIELFFSK